MLRTILTALVGMSEPINSARTWRDSLPGLIRADAAEKGAPLSLSEWNARQIALANAVCLLYTDEMEREGLHRLDVLASVAAEFPRHVPRAYLSPATVTA